MNSLTVRQTLLECGGEARVLLASDEAARPVVGLALATDPAHPSVFVQIDRVTMLELQRGTVELSTVLAERCAGITLHA